MAKFTPEELAELRAFDAEIDEEDEELSEEERLASLRLDIAASSTGADRYVSAAKSTNPPGRKPKYHTPEERKLAERESNRKWREAHRDKTREAYRNWYATHKTEVMAKNKRWRDSHKEAYLEQRRLAYKRKKEKEE